MLGTVVYHSHQYHHRLTIRPRQPSFALELTYQRNAKHLSSMCGKLPIIQGSNRFRLSDLKQAGFFATLRWPASNVNCLTCGRRSYRHGKRRHGRIHIQQYRCRGCRKVFTEYTGTPLEGTSLDARMWLAIEIWTGRAPDLRPSLRAIARKLRISHETVRQWATFKLKNKDHWHTLRRRPRRSLFASSTIFLKVKEPEPRTKNRLNLRKIIVHVSQRRVFRR